MKRVFVNGLRVFRGLILQAVFGDAMKLPNEPKINGSITYPENQPSLNEWLEMYRVGVSLPKRIVLTKEQICDKFGFNSTELVIR
jgi:hypothetical protein